jgi:hypothetical protein
MINESGLVDGKIIQIRTICYSNLLNIANAVVMYMIYDVLALRYRTTLEDNCFRSSTATTHQPLL